MSFRLALCNFASMLAFSFRMFILSFKNALREIRDSFISFKELPKVDNDEYTKVKTYQKRTYTKILGNKSKKKAKKVSKK